MINNKLVFPTCFDRIVKCRKENSDCIFQLHKLVVFLKEYYVYSVRADCLEFSFNAACTIVV